MSEVFLIFFIFSMILLFVLVLQFKDRVSMYYALLFVCIMITNFGYMQVARAKDLSAALFANQIVYLGGAFSPYFLLMCLADLCKVTINKIYQVICILYGCVIFAFVSTIGVYPWYYKDVSIASKDGITVLVKDYGSFHILYPLYLLVILAIGLTLIVKAILKKKDVSYLTSIMLLICMFLVVVVYLLRGPLHLPEWSISVSYVGTQLAILFLLTRISLYDVTAISTDSMVQNRSYGFIVFDSNGKYLGGDEMAKKWFPELLDIQIDSVVKEEKTDLLSQMGRWLRDKDEQDIVYFGRGKCILEAKHVILRESHRKTVHCVYLRDDTDRQEYIRLVENYNDTLEKEVNAKEKKIRKIENDIILSMASIVENRDSNTGGHIARTSDVVNIFVYHLLKQKCFKELNPKIAGSIIMAAPLHDFGKIAIPDLILNKPGKFTDEEYEEMKKHSAKGAEMVQQIFKHSEDEVFSKIAINVAHYHHERWDGKGYPEGIKGEEIPFEARVMALADVFDALVSKRVYKEKFSYDKAFSIIEESGGSQFDPDLCKEFLKCRSDFELLYDSYEDD